MSHERGSLALCEGTPIQRDSGAGCDVFFHISLNKWLKNEFSFLWFEIPQRSCSATEMKTAAHIQLRWFFGSVFVGLSYASYRTHVKYNNSDSINSTGWCEKDIALELRFLHLPIEMYYLKHNGFTNIFRVTLSHTSHFYKSFALINVLSGNKVLPKMRW